MKNYNRKVNEVQVMPRLNIVAVILAALALAACDAGPKNPAMATVELPPEARSTLERIEVIVSQQQKQINASSMPAPGLTVVTAITAGINTARVTDRVELINNALPTFDCPDEVLRAVQQAFTRVDKVNISGSPILVTSPTAYQAAYDASTADAVLFFAVTVSLSEYGNLLFDGWLALRPKSEALKKFSPKSDDATAAGAGTAIFRKHTQIVRYLSTASVPEKVRGVFATGARDLAAWAATEVNALK